ncbi:MAG: YveK family protein [Clostridium sp.]
MNEEVIKIGDIVEALKKRIALILAITIGCTVLSAVVSFFVIKPKYEATTKLFIGNDETKKNDYNSNDVQMYQKLLKTYAEIIQTYDLIDKAVEKSNLDITTGEALGGLTVVPRADTQILEIKIKHGDPQVAMKLVDGITTEFMKTSKELISNGNVKVIQEVSLPQNPVSPNKTMNVAIAFLLGAMLGVGLALLLEFLDNTYKNKDQLEADLGLPVLGVIAIEE